jgi:hypothetical protein
VVVKKNERGYYVSIQMIGLLSMAKEHNIFISHAWDYTADVEPLRTLINAKTYIEIQSIWKGIHFEK